MSLFGKKSFTLGHFKFSRVRIDQPVKAWDKPEAICVKLFILIRVQWFSSWKSFCQFFPRRRALLRNRVRLFRLRRSHHQGQPPHRAVRPQAPQLWVLNLHLYQRDVYLPCLWSLLTTSKSTNTGPRSAARFKIFCYICIQNIYIKHFFALNASVSQ